jgi:hypothetical protein
MLGSEDAVREYVEHQAGTVPAGEVTPGERTLFDLPAATGQDQLRWTPAEVERVMAYTPHDPSRMPDRPDGSPGPPPTAPTGQPSDVARAEGQEVECAVFAPPEVLPGRHLLIQVFAYWFGLVAEAEQLARRFDRQSEQRGFTSLGVNIRNGQELYFHLAVPGLTIPEPVRRLTWRGHTASVQFRASVPLEATPGEVAGTVTVSADSVPIGQIDFLLTVGAAATAAGEQSVSVGRAARNFRRAFLSYASPDRAEVARRAQMLRVQGVEFFYDILSIEPGEEFEGRLFQEIEACDLFLLFWSRNAQASDWVSREVQYAVQRQGPSRNLPPHIFPVPIEGPPVAMPPPEGLEHLNFNDFLIYLMR